MKYSRNRTRRRRRRGKRTRRVRHRRHRRKTRRLRRKLRSRKRRPRRRRRRRGGAVNALKRLWDDASPIDRGIVAGATTNPLVGVGVYALSKKKSKRRRRRRRRRRMRGGVPPANTPPPGCVDGICGKGDTNPTDVAAGACVRGYSGALADGPSGDCANVGILDPKR